MQPTQHVLISLDERHATNILVGTKQVELRRRTMHVEPGSTVWLYVKKPVGAVVGFATVGKTYSAAPSTVWRKYGPVSGLSKSEFMNYFDGTVVATAMALSGSRKLKAPITLDALRAAMPGFHPPQFYCRLKTDSSIKLRLSMEQ
ncbi:transcriptional regulator [Hydrogenophaga sp. BPS33]|uniref:transcriptional regulator n=1 Tax=Hydrogenophaga sp. BPS33 TaxID=2651974 RepID=UPI0013203014|nr:transcriptional regulator [Hydrogenophaga sp. BPS33]QHE88570.1 transcriptional regulator [Hydrogenophaga sp. BPS33]